MHPYNLGELVLHVRGDVTTPMPCTPRGVIELLKAYDIDLNGKEVCVLGRGITVGRSACCWSRCERHGDGGRRRHQGRARPYAQGGRDVAAMGVARVSSGGRCEGGRRAGRCGCKPRVRRRPARYRIQGDIDKDCRERCGAYTPNPGGVGPMTRAMLLAVSWRPPNADCLRGCRSSTRRDTPRILGAGCL